MITTLGQRETRENGVVLDTRHPVEIDDVDYEFSEPCATPNWNRRKNAGELIVNPYSASKVIQPAHAGVYWTSEYIPTGPKDKRRDLWESWFSPSQFDTYFGIKASDFPDPDPSFSKEALITKAKAKANEAVWDASTSLAEMGETIAMLASLVAGARRPVKTLTEFFTRSVKGKAGGRRFSIRQAFDTGSAGWLQWRYGVRPLIGDIQSAIDAWNAEVELRFRKSVRPSGEDTYVGTVDLWSTPTSRRPALRFGFEQGQFSNRGQCVITSDFHYESTRSYFLDQLGFKPRAAPKVAWELIPFSFIVDWFVNVGQWIDTVSDPSGLVQRAGCYSARDYRKTIRKYSALQWEEGKGTNNHWRLRTPAFSVSYERSSFSREVVNTSDLQTPNWGSGFNLARSFDLGAIFLQISRILKR